MAKYEVEVQVTKLLAKPLTVYADSPEEAEEKAVDMVLKWDGVIDAESHGEAKLI